MASGERLTLSRLRRAFLFLGWLWAIAIFYLSLTPYPPQPVSFEFSDKFEHALAYAFLMLWFCQIYQVPKGRVIVAAMLIAMGIGIEYLQRMTGYRFFEYADMLANSTGVLLGWIAGRTRLGDMLLALEQRFMAAGDK